MLGAKSQLYVFLDVYINSNGLFCMSQKLIFANCKSVTSENQYYLSPYVVVYIPLCEISLTGGHWPVVREKSIKFGSIIPVQQLCTGDEGYLFSGTSVWHALCLLRLRERLWSIVMSISVCLFFFGQLFTSRVDLIQPVSNVHPYVRHPHKVCSISMKCGL